MSDGINWNSVYEDYITEFTSGVDQTSPDYEDIVAAARRKAGELAAYGRVSGSKKNPTQWYTFGEWLDYSAPSYRAIRNYTGSDRASQIVSEEIKKLESDDKRTFNLAEVSNIAKILSDEGYTRGEAFDIVKSVYDEFTTAKRNFKRQKTSHPYARFGLPDPTAIYGFQDDTKTTFVIDSNGKAVKRKVKVVAYPGAKQWVDNKTKAYKNKLVSQGIDSATAETRALAYGDSLKTAVEKKIKQSGVTPFIEAAAKRARTRG